MERLTKEMARRSGKGRVSRVARDEQEESEERAEQKRKRQLMVR